MSTTGKPSLFEMPGIVMDIILEKLEFRSIMTLRKVCHPLRDYIDKKKPEANFTMLDFNYSPKSIRMIYKLDEKEGFIIYTSEDNGCSVNHGNKEIRINNVSMEEISFQDFENILKFQRKELEKLCIFSYPTEREIHLNVLTKMGEIISKFSKLKVKELNLDAIGENDLLLILPYLAPGILKKLRTPCKFDQDPRHLELTQIVQLEQWEQLETVEIYTHFVLPGIEHFLHLSSATLFFKTITAEEWAMVQKVIFRKSEILNWQINEKRRKVESSLGSAHFEYSGQRRRGSAFSTHLPREIRDRRSLDMMLLCLQIFKFRLYTVYVDP